MAIDFGQKFGASAQQSSSRRGGNTTDQPKAQVWLNIGYQVDGVEEGKYDFVSLPTGIPLDTMEGTKVSGSDPTYKNFQSARNDLMTQLQELASELQPGESGIVPLAIQIRRVAEPVTATPAEDNPFGMKVQLVVRD